MPYLPHTTDIFPTPYLVSHASSHYMHQPFVTCLHASLTWCTLHLIPICALHTIPICALHTIPICALHTIPTHASCVLPLPDALCILYPYVPCIPYPHVPHVSYLYPMHHASCTHMCFTYHTHTCLACLTIAYLHTQPYIDANCFTCLHFHRIPQPLTFLTSLLLLTPYSTHLTSHTSYPCTSSLMSHSVLPFHRVSCPMCLT